MRLLVRQVSLLGWALGFNARYISSFDPIWYHSTVYGMEWPSDCVQSPTARIILPHSFSGEGSQTTREMLFNGTAEAFV